MIVGNWNWRAVVSFQHKEYVGDGVENTAEQKRLQLWVSRVDLMGLMMSLQLSCST
jgi:hypothetical protein